MSSERRVALKLLTLGSLGLLADAFTSDRSTTEAKALPEYLKDEEVYLEYMRELLNPREFMGSVLADLDELHAAFAPEEQNPSFAQEVASLPHLTSPINEPLTVPINWTNEKKLEIYQNLSPNLLDFILKPKPYLPRTNPVLSLWDATMDIQPLPHFPGSIILEPGLLKAQVLTLTTNERFGERNFMQIRWFVLTNRLTAPHLTPKDGLSYPAQIIIGSRGNPDGQFSGGPGVVELRPQSFSGHLFFAQDVIPLAFYEQKTPLDLSTL